jgi:glutamate-ammonia-ligase adenylyltransferase
MEASREGRDRDLGPGMSRSSSLAGRLARLGVVAAASMAEALEASSWWREELITPLGDVADPALALGAVLRVGEVARDELAVVAGDSQAWRALLLVTGVSAAIGDQLVRRPEVLAEFGDFPELADPIRAASGLAALAPREGPLTSPDRTLAARS